jgi:hypothetical protein
VRNLTLDDRAEVKLIKHMLANDITLAPLFKQFAKQGMKRVVNVKIESDMQPGLGLGE